MKKNDITIITQEEAIQLLLENTALEVEQITSSETIFDAYGNYSFPFDTKIKEPNVASGYAFVETISFK